MSWIHTLLNLLFPPPVPLTSFKLLPPARAHDHEPWIFAGTQYKGDTKKIVKYIKATPDAIYLQEAAKVMARTLESYLLETAMFESGAIILVPVPQHTSRTDERGFNQSELLAHHIETLLPYTTLQKALQKTRKTEKQALLPKKLRITNQNNAFTTTHTCEDISKNDLLVIIDDVSTTGSTLCACKTALQQRGFKNVIGLVFAH